MNRDQGRWGRRTAARLGAVLAAPLVVLAVAGPAGAHVTITPSTSSPGAHAVLEVSLAHGCEGSPTTEVTIQIPEGINAVSPTRHALWESEVEIVPLDPPATDSHGNQVTERVASVTYRAVTPLPDGHRDAFELSLQLPEAEGTLVFPTIQTCEEGESAWIEVAEPGQDPHELTLPAPTVVVAAAEPVENVDSDSDVPVVAYAALALSVLGVALGVTCLVRQRRST